MKESNMGAVFDYLYKSYRDKRNELLRKKKRVSEYDSENLMYHLICTVLGDEQFAKFDVAPHVPLKMILRDTKRLDDNEKRYAENILTHVDFLIFDKLGKFPRLAVEVDGAAFHAENTRQAERDKLKDGILEKYALPLLRLKTTGSGEREQLISKLKII